jgi:hypothetical protein
MRERVVLLFIYNDSYCISREHYDSGLNIHIRDFSFFFFIINSNFEIDLSYLSLVWLFCLMFLFEGNMYFMIILNNNMSWTHKFRITQQIEKYLSLGGDFNFDLFSYLNKFSWLKKDWKEKN